MKSWRSWISYLFDKKFLWINCFPTEKLMGFSIVVFYFLRKLCSNFNFSFAVGTMFLDIKPSLDTLIVEYVLTIKFNAICSIFKWIPANGATKITKKHTQRVHWGFDFCISWHEETPFFWGQVLWKLSQFFIPTPTVLHRSCCPRRLHRSTHHRLHHSTLLSTIGAWEPWNVSAVAQGLRKMRLKWIGCWIEELMKNFSVGLFIVIRLFVVGFRLGFVFSIGSSFWQLRF